MSRDLQKRTRKTGVRRLTREQTRQAVACPLCRAPIGETCQGRRGDRAGNHLERRIAALVIANG